MRINHFTKVRFVDFIKSNVIFIFHYLLFLICFLIGSFAVLFNFSFFDRAIVISLVKHICDLDLWIGFKYYIIFYASILSLIYFLSFYPFGAPMVVFVFSALSYCIGNIFTVVCSEFGLNGLLFNIIVFVFPVAFSLIIYAFISAASLPFSTNMALIVLKNKGAFEVRQKAKDLFILYLILIVAITINSLLMSFLTTVSSGIITN